MTHTNRYAPWSPPFCLGPLVAQGPQVFEQITVRRLRRRRRYCPRQELLSNVRRRRRRRCLSSR